VNALGFGRVAMYATAIAAGVLIVGYIVYLADRRLSQKVN
jgi:hypothetical protein